MHRDATARARAEGLAIWRAALAAVDPEALVRRHLVVPDGVGAVRVLGAGKAAAAMARGAEAVLGDRLAGGVVVVKDGHGLPLRRVEVLEAGHPDPDERSEAAGRRLLVEAGKAGVDDVIVGLWSGGGSALIEVPAEGHTLTGIRRSVAAKMAAGADIHALNDLRRSRSAIKGGKLAAASPARFVNLVLSDVAGDDPAVVASGPAVQPGDGSMVIGSLSVAVDGAAAAARDLGYDVERGSEVVGEASAVGQALGRTARAVLPGRCLLWAGEPVVTMGETAGRGGRMQEAALAAALAIEGSDVVVLCAGTDGTDGPTDAAGALVDGGTAGRIRAAGLDPEAHLRGHDAYPALDAAGDLLRTGPTRTNVRDVMVALRPR